MERRFFLKLVFIFLFLFLFMQTEAQFIDNRKKRVYSEYERGQEEKEKLEKENTFAEGLEKQTYIKNLRLETIREKSNTHVKLTWLPFDSLEEIMVLRSLVAITNEKQFYSSKVLAVLPAKTDSYIDKNVLSGSYYYAVVSRPILEKSKIELYANENYTLTPVVIKNFPEQVKKIKAIKNKANEITVSWQPLDEKVFYAIYRSRSPLSSADMLTNNNMIALLSYNQNNFVDKASFEEGDYYYAVATRNNRGEEDKNLIANESYTTNLITSIQKIEEPPQEPPARVQEKATPAERKSKNIFTAHVKKEQVKLSWKVQNFLWGSDIDLEPKEKIAIYRFYKKPQDFEDLVVGNLVATPYYHEGEAVDKPAQSGHYYYAIFFQSPQGLQPQSFDFGYNLIGPTVYSAEASSQDIKPLPTLNNMLLEKSVVPQSSKTKETLQKPAPSNITQNKPPQELLDKVTIIVKNSYFKNSYEEAILKLEPYLDHENLLVQALSKYYSGLSLYRLGKFSQATSFFKDNLVQKAYKEKAIFWYKRSKEYGR